MLKPLVVGTSLALAALSLPATAQQRTPGTTGQQPTQQQPTQPPAQKDMGAATQTLNLTQEEKHTVLQNVDKAAMKSDKNSTMGLGALTEGSSVPSGMQMQKFNNTVTTKVPKLKNYSYFTAENKVAIVDPNGNKIAAVLDMSATQAK